MVGSGIAGGNPPLFWGSDFFEDAFLIGGVRLSPLRVLSARSVPDGVLLLPALLVLPPRLTILPRIPTISAASSKLSSSIPSWALYTSAMACLASRRQACES